MSKEIRNSIFGLAEGATGGFSWSSYWKSLISATVENAAPTHVVLTFTSAKTVQTSDFSISGFTIDSLSWSGNVLTLVLTEAVIIFDENLIITFNKTGQTATVTNNVADDGNTLAWYDYSDLATITKDINGLVSKWSAKIGTDVDLVQATEIKQPIYGSDGILFDGSDDFIQSPTWSPATAQPHFIYLLFKQITWTGGDNIVDLSVATTILRQSSTGASPNLAAFAGSVGGDNSDLPLNTLGILRLLFNGASSKLIINDGVPVTGDWGAQYKDSITIGARKNGLLPANIQVQEFILRKSTANESLIYKYLSKKKMINYGYLNKLSVGVKVSAINDNYAVGFNGSNELCFSSDYGEIWGTPYDWTSNGTVTNITYIHITKNGIVIVFDPNANKVWRSNDQCSSFNEITPTDKNGSPIIPHVPVNPLYKGNYYAPFSPIVENNGVLFWGNYGNVLQGAAPIRLFYSTDDCATIKTVYEFGQTALYTDTGTAIAGAGGTPLGDIDNPIWTRHVHGTNYNPYNGKYYAFCGDANGDNHFIELTYNIGLDIWSLVYLKQGGDQHYRAITAGFDDNNNIYFGSDGDGIFKTFKCSLSEIADENNFEVLIDNINKTIYGFLKDENIIIQTKSTQSSGLNISIDSGVNWDSFIVPPSIISQFNIGEFQMIHRISHGLYFITTRVPSLGGFYLKIWD